MGIWFNHHRLLEPIGYIPPAQAEANYYQQLAKKATWKFNLTASSKRGAIQSALDEVFVDNLMPRTGHGSRDYESECVICSAPYSRSSTILVALLMARQPSMSSLGLKSISRQAADAT